ncbi:FecR domain-containing protein [Undibacterium sp. TJN25]|uniref:FecR domain-containing protein n=1 Tax=Undibacterium sp. TJN25 TaxID=3413056 RepID=UPI003BF1B01F
MKRKLNYLIKLFALLLCSAASMAHADEAGHIVFVAGKAEIGGQKVALNAAVNEGAELSTGADGYLYLKTVDNGFFILRPNSRARIVSYHVDQKDPSNTHIKLELLNGVARSISGEAVKQARQNFRFNTPVAAIGVRGTDFTVFTTQETSRVAVSYGGVIVSGFGGACAPQGTGPCEGGASVELFARQRDQLVQISRGQNKPQLLQSTGAAPDVIAPPRSDEPTGGKAGGASNSVSGVNAAAPEVYLDPQKVAAIAAEISAVPVGPVTPVTPVLPPVSPSDTNVPANIIWGRWVSVLGQASNVDFNKQFNQSKFIARNDYFALFQIKNTEWQLPTTGTAGFALQNSEVYVNNSKTNTINTASLENAVLTIDFAKTTFSTSFDLVNGGQHYNQHAQGKVYGDGQFGALNFIPNTMLVNGVLSSEKGGAASYLFQTRLDDNNLASGATYWIKQK